MRDLNLARCGFAAYFWQAIPVIQAVCGNPAVVSTDSQLWDAEASLSAITLAPLEDTQFTWCEDRSGDVMTRFQLATESPDSRGLILTSSTVYGVSVLL